MVLRSLQVLLGYSGAEGQGDLFFGVFFFLLLNTKLLSRKKTVPGAVCQHSGSYHTELASRENMYQTSVK